MEPDPIEQLLREADSAATQTPRGAESLAADVLQASRRRTIVRGATASFAIILVIGATAMLVNRAAAPAPANPTPVAMLPDISALNREIAATESRIHALVAGEHLSRYQARLIELSSRPTARDLTEYAASAMVLQADRLVRTARLDAQAMKCYDDVINHFPDTASADVARKRMAELKKEG